MRRTKVLLMTAVAVVGCFIVRAASDACHLSPDLFHRRASLVAELDSAAKANDHKFAVAEPNIRTKIKAIDLQYYQFMKVVSDSVGQHDIAQLGTCCGGNAADAIAVLICRFASYRARLTTPDQFVRDFPAHGVSQQALWALDEIADVEHGPDSLPPLFKPDGPTGSYISELFKLVSLGEGAAFKKYLDLYLDADGFYAELMEDQLEQLFLEHPDIVLRNWSLVRANKRVLPDLQESLSADQKRRIRSEVKKRCSINTEACQQLVVALK